MLGAGISVQVLPSEGNPIVIGELNVDSASKTLFFNCVPFFGSHGEEALLLKLARLL